MSLLHQLLAQFSISGSAWFFVASCSLQVLAEHTLQSAYPARHNTIWMVQEEQEGRIDNELAVVLSSIAVACKQIASMVNRAGISNLTGAAGEQNFSGEDQKKLDVVSNEVFSNCLRASGRTVS